MHPRPSALLAAMALLLAVPQFRAAPPASAAVTDSAYRPEDPWAWVTDDVRAGFAEQRAFYRLAAIPAGKLVVSAAQRALYVEFSLAIEPSEAAAWRKRVALQEQILLALNELAKRPEYLDARVDYNPDRATVWVRQDALAASTATVGGLPITVIPSAFSRADALAEESRVIADLPVLRSSVSADGLTVTVERGQKEAAEAALSSKGPGLPVVVVEGEEQTATDGQCSARSRCTPDGGGTTVYDDTFPSVPSCTSGFVVKKNSDTSLRAATTAGHCDNAYRLGSGWSVGDAVNYPCCYTPAGTVSNVGAWEAGSLDLMVLSPGATNFRNMMQNVYNEDPAHRTQQVGTSVSYLGLRACVSGRNFLERRCGTVIGLDWDGQVGCESGCHSQDQFFDLNVDAAAHGMLTGDSGAPVTAESSPTFALGIASGFLDNRANGEGDRIVGTLAENLTLSGWSLLTGDAYSGRPGSRNFIIEGYDLGLLRAPDNGGLAYYFGQLGINPCTSHASQMVIDIMQSAELKNARPIVGAGASYDNAVRRVRRLYWFAFGRDADSGGVTYWAGVVWSGGEAAWSNTVASFIANSEHAGRVINGVAGTLPACP